MEDRIIKIVLVKIDHRLAANEYNECVHVIILTVLVDCCIASIFIVIS